MKHRCSHCFAEIESPGVCPRCTASQSQENEPHQLPRGTLLQDRYLLGRVLGQGGFGITYIGLDQKLNRRIAVKEYFPGGLVTRETAQSCLVSCTLGTDAFSKGRDRFLKEAQILARLQQVAGIARVYSFFESNQTAYIVMEYVDGQTLQQAVQAHGGKLPAKEVLRILAYVIDTLTQVHQAGLIHRDISPDNIMLLEDGSIKLLDFGTARDTESSHTQSTQAVLKYGYAPMEQYQKHGKTGPWTDEYALCATAYYCLTGKIPPEAPTRLVEGTEIDWTGVRGLTASQKEALSTGMALRVEQRYSDLDALADALFVKPRTGRPKLWLVLAAAVVTAVALAALLLSRQSGPAAPTLSTVPTETPLPTVPTVATTEATEPDPPAVTAPETPVPTEPEPWHNNIMRPIVRLYDNYGREETYIPGSTVKKRSSIRTITFWDTLEDAPATAWDISYSSEGQVLVWVENDIHLHIAGEGGVVLPSQCNQLFSGYTQLKEIHFNGRVATQENCQTMVEMFANCPMLEELDLSFLNTESVLNMSSMFRGCKNLKSLKLSGWDTAKVTTMAGMFRDCQSLTSLDLSGFDTSQVTDMGAMFYGCDSLTDLDLGIWETDSVKNSVNFMNEGTQYHGQSWEALFQ